MPEDGGDSSSGWLIRCPEAVSEPGPEHMKKTLVNPYVLPVLFPQRLWKQNTDKQLSEFVNMFKKLHINIPFAETLAQMPKYGKFMKDILRNKKKLEDHETVMLNEECSAILSNKLLLELKDRESFSIPCKIETYQFEKALCDFEARINLMSLSVFKKLGSGEATPMIISL